MVAQCQRRLCGYELNWLSLLELLKTDASGGHPYDPWAAIARGLCHHHRDAMTACSIGLCGMSLLPPMVVVSAAVIFDAKKMHSALSWHIWPATSLQSIGRHAVSYANHDYRPTCS